MDYYYKQPLYYSRFKCIGGACPESCCGGTWGIVWLENEYEKLMSADMSDELRSIAERAFVINEHLSFNDTIKRYVIKPEKRAAFSENISDETDNSISAGMRLKDKCPFQDTKTGLCLIQKELGESYLSITCRYYPREYIVQNNIVFANLSATCPAVFDILAKEEGCTILENRLIRNRNEIRERYMPVIDPKKTEKHKYLKYYTDIMDLYGELFNNHEHSTELSIIAGAIAAKHISDATERPVYNDVKKVIDDMKVQLSSPTIYNSLNEINPNYELKFKIVNNVIVKFFGQFGGNELNLSYLHDGSRLIEVNYLKGMENFNKAFGNKEFVINNIIINTFYNIMSTNFNDKDTLFERYTYFTIAAASLKLVAVAIGFSSQNILEDYRNVVSRISRTISHNREAYKKVLRDITDLGLTSPAHLALIIK